MKDSEIKVNKSKTYLLYYFKEIYKVRRFPNLINTYLFFDREPKVCFLYRFKGEKAFVDYEASLLKNEHFHKMIDIGEDKVLYVFNVDDNLLSIIDIFLRGQYSKLPDTEGLISFLKSNFNATEDSKTIRIIRKDITLKREIEEDLGTKIGDLDLSSSPDVESENFTQPQDEKESKKDDNFGAIDNIQDRF